LSSQNIPAYKRLTACALAALFLLVLTLLLIRVPASAGPPSPADSTDSTLVATAPFSTGNRSAVSTTIRPVHGGKLNGPGESVRVTFLSDAVSSPQVVTLTLGTASAFPQRLTSIGPAFHLEVGQSGMTETMQPFTITMQYTDTHKAGEVVIAWWDPPRQVAPVTDTGQHGHADRHCSGNPSHSVCRRPAVSGIRITTASYCGGRYERRIRYWWHT